MKRIPLVATALVVFAAAAMVGLGAWQLQRHGEKIALLARYAQNQHLPPIAFPRIPVDDKLLFRRAGFLCLQVTGWAHEGGRNAKGGVGWRHIARCRTGAEGPGVTVQVGMSQSPDDRPVWKGGEVAGYITNAPDHAPLVARLVGRQPPKTLMLVADPPLAGLAANPAADLSSVPNNHLAYAVQWFVFAALALGIYALALRSRMKAR
ncbi:MAG: SURF1 family protein [Sphingomonas sp.]